MVRASIHAIALASMIAALVRCSGETDVLDLLPKPLMMTKDAAGGGGMEAGKPGPAACTRDADCTMAATRLCRVSDGTCVACLADADCAAGDTCDAASATCHHAP